jgi:hypothetical protein
MSLRDQFLDLLAPTFTWLPAGSGVFLVTEHMGNKLPTPVKLHLDEELFDRHARWVARTAEGGNLENALGLILVHLDEEITSVSDGMVLTDVGLRPRGLRRPVWFSKRMKASAVDSRPRSVWVTDPPLG